MEKRLGASGLTSSDDQILEGWVTGPGGRGSGAWLCSEQLDVTGSGLGSSTSGLPLVGRTHLSKHPSKLHPGVIWIL